jgi:hypothetical protein
MNTKLWKFQAAPPAYFRGSQYEQDSVQVFSLSQSDQIHIINSQSQPELGSIGLTPSLYSEQLQLKPKYNFVHPGMSQADKIDLEYEFCSYPNLTPIPDTFKSVLNGETPSPIQSKCAANILYALEKSTQDRSPPKRKKIPVVFEAKSKEFQFLFENKLQDDSNIEIETQSQFLKVDYESESITQPQKSQHNTDNTNDLLSDHNSPMFTALSETEEIEFVSKINLHYSDSDDDDKVTSQSIIVLEKRVSDILYVKSSADAGKNEQKGILSTNIRNQDRTGGTPTN